MSAQGAHSENGLIGRVLGGKFRLRSYIGEGSSGTVYQADQVTLGRTVAVKILNPELARDTRLVSRFHDEALAASRLNHPNTVSVIDYGQTDDGLLYIVMEYLRGVTLTQVIADESPLSKERIIDIVSQILSGLEEAHEASVVHADLKADNIVIEHRRGGWYLVKVVDFGIARIMGKPRTDEDKRTICGTPEYMAPEVIGGNDPTFASDLYAVGVTLYEMLTGETPFVGGSSIEVLTRHIRELPVAPHLRRPDLKIDPQLEQIAMRALAKHPGERFASATELRAALESTRSSRSPHTEEQMLCNACGVYAPASFNFCPECGQPRATANSAIDTIPNFTPISIDDEPTEAITSPQSPTAVRFVDIEVDDAVSDAVVSIFPLPLLGRDSLVAEIVDFVASDEHHYLSLSGTSGSGRTRLLYEVERELKANTDVAIYRCAPDPSGLKAPFYPLRGLVAAVLNLPPVCAYDQLSAGLEVLGLSRRDLPGVAELFGHHGELWQLDPEVRRRELFASTTRVLKAANMLQGTAVFLLDDIDRYDQPSRDLLLRLAELRESLPLRIIATCERGFNIDWPAHIRQLELTPLGEDDYAALVTHLEAVLQDQTPSAQELARHTAGSPNHLQHLVRFMVEGGELSSAPEQLADLISERLGALPPSARLLCQAGAAFGLSAERSLLQQVLGKRLDMQEVQPALSLLVARGLMTPLDQDDSLSFQHALVREVVYDATPADVRRAFHDQIVKALEPVTSDSLLLGHHYDLAGDDQRAAMHLQRAGDDAVRQLDDTGAIALFERALKSARQLMLSDDDMKSRIRFVTLSVKLADALRVCRRFSLARGLIEEARGHSNGTPRLEAQLLQAAAHLHAGEKKFPLAIDELKRGIGMIIPIGDMEILAELYLDLSSVFMDKGEPERALEELHEGINLVTLSEGVAAERGPKLLWRLVLRLAQLYSSTNRMKHAVQLAERALAHARRTRSRVGSARAQTLLASYYEQLGDLRLADKYRQAAVTELRRLGDRRGTAELLLSGVVPTRTLMRIDPANLREARELADEVGWAEGVAKASRRTDRLKARGDRRAPSPSDDKGGR